MHSFPLLQPASVRKNLHFGFGLSSSVDLSLVFGLFLSASKYLIFTSPFGIAAVALFSERATCSISAKRCVANWLTVVSVGLVSTPREFRARLTLNCSSLLDSRTRRVNLFRPFNNSAGSGVTAPISWDRSFQRSHRRIAAGASPTVVTSVGSSKLLSNVCFSKTPPGQYVNSSCVKIPKTLSRRAETNSSLTTSGTD